MMGLAIAYESRRQVNFNTEPINLYPEFNFKVEEAEDLDFGERIQVV